jgi:hypothetical protein
LLLPYHPQNTGTESFKYRACQVQRTQLLRPACTDLHWKKAIYYQQTRNVAFEKTRGMARGRPLAGERSLSHQFGPGGAGAVLGPGFSRREKMWRILFMVCIPAIYSFSIKTGTSPQFVQNSKAQSCLHRLRTPGASLFQVKKQLTAQNPYFSLRRKECYAMLSNHDEEVSTSNYAESDDLQTTESCASLNSTSFEVARLRSEMKEAVRDNAPRRIMNILQFDNSHGSSDLLTTSERAEVRLMPHFRNPTSGGRGMGYVSSLHGNCTLKIGIVALSNSCTTIHMLLLLSRPLDYPDARSSLRDPYHQDKGGIRTRGCLRISYVRVYMNRVYTCTDRIHA